MMDKDRDFCMYSLSEQCNLWRRKQWIQHKAALLILDNVPTGFCIIKNRHFLCFWKFVVKKTQEHILRYYGLAFSL